MSTNLRPVLGQKYGFPGDFRVVVDIRYDRRVEWRRPGGDTIFSSSALGWAKWIQSQQVPRTKIRKRSKYKNAKPWKNDPSWTVEHGVDDDIPF